jgi:pilus assembly protein Flp/PilA
MLDKAKLLLWRFRFDRSGVTAVEYGVIAAGIVVVIIATILLIGPRLDIAFGKVRDGLPAI